MQSKPKETQTKRARKGADEPLMAWPRLVDPALAVPAGRAAERDTPGTPAKVSPGGLDAFPEVDPDLMDVKKAMEEITAIPPALLHRTSAFTWASRSIASFRLCSTAADLERCMKCFYLGEHYREAALAHAAMGEDWQGLYDEIDRAVKLDRALAFQAMDARWASASAATGRAPARRKPGRKR